MENKPVFRCLTLHVLRSDKKKKRKRVIAELTLRIVWLPTFQKLSRIFGRGTTVSTKERCHYEIARGVIMISKTRPLLLSESNKR